MFSHLVRNCHRLGLSLRDRIVFSSSTAPFRMSERATDELPDAKRRKIDTEKDTGKGKAQEATKKRRPGSRIEAPMVRAEGEEREARLPKRMCALLLGFCGSPYRGMQ